jgi:hypothetical protein
MRFFIASPWKNKVAVQELADGLRKQGHEVYSFLESGANVSNGQPIGEELNVFNQALSNWQSDPGIKRVFDAEMEGLKNSEAVILLQPAGHSSLLEAGIGYGMGKKVFVVGPVEKPEVVYLISQSFYPDTATFLSAPK